MNVEWRTDRFDACLSARRADLWAVGLSANPHTLEQCSGVLSQAERQRAERFRFDRHREAFIIAHGILRWLLGRYLHQDPSSLEFVTSLEGKPSLTGKRTPLAFNLSHAGDLALYAFCLDADVGVDLEPVRDMPDAMSLASTVFSTGEQAMLRALPAEAVSRSFLRCWTRKEAVVKAYGRGLSVPLPSVDVLPLEESRIRVEIADGPHRNNRWWVYDCPPDSSYAAAIALTTDGWAFTGCRAQTADELLDRWIA